MRPTDAGRRVGVCAVAAAIVLGVLGCASAPAPTGEPAAIAPVALPALEALDYPPLPELDVPEPVRRELANGLVLVLVEDRELPLIDAFFRIRTGSRLEPEEKAGLAGLVGEVLRTGGTSARSGPEIDRFLENRAASVETFIGVDYGGASVSALKEDFADVLAVAVEILRQPVFDAAMLEVAKNRLNAGIARQNDTPNAILGREFTEVVRGPESPYAREVTFSSVAAIDRVDLAAFHRRYFHPGNMILGIVGDFETEAMIALVEELFADWPGRPPTPPFEGGYKTEPTPGVYFVEKNDVNQSSILIGHLGVRKDHPDFYAIEVFNELFSGGFTARLLSRIRSEQGLAYSVSGALGSGWDREGLFQLFTSTKTETTGAAIEALIAETRKIAGEEPPTVEEVERAKRNLLSSFVFTSDSAAEILQRQLLYEYFGYPLDRLSHYVDRVERVTADDVARVAREVLDADALTIFVVGPGEGRDRSLEEFGDLTEVDVTIPPLDEGWVAEMRDARRRGSELLARVVDAHGGEALFRRFENIRQRASAVASTPQGEMTAEIDQWVVFPDRLRQVVELPFGTMTTTATGDGAWVVTPQGRRDLAGAQLRNVLAGVPRTLPVLLRLAAEGAVAASAAGDGTIGEAAVEHLEVEAGSERFRLSVDAESGRIRALEFEGTDFSGAVGRVSQAYSDYREVDGMWLPFRVVATFEGAPYLESTIEDANWSLEVMPGLFERAD